MIDKGIKQVIRYGTEDHTPSDDYLIPYKVHPDVSRLIRSLERDQLKYIVVPRNRFRRNWK